MPLIFSDVYEMRPATLICYIYCFRWNELWPHDLILQCSFFKSFLRAVSQSHSALCEGWQVILQNDRYVQTLLCIFMKSLCFLTFIKLEMIIQVDLSAVLTDVSSKNRGSFQDIATWSRELSCCNKRWWWWMNGPRDIVTLSLCIEIADNEMQPMFLVCGFCLPVP